MTYGYSCFCIDCRETIVRTDSLSSEREVVDDILEGDFQDMAMDEFIDEYERRYDKKFTKEDFQYWSLITCERIGHDIVKESI